MRICFGRCQNPDESADPLAAVTTTPMYALRIN